MIAFFITILWFLLYSAAALALAWFLCWAFEQLFGRPVSPRARQVLYGVVVILLVIWLLTSFAGGPPIVAPWEWRSR